MIVPCQHCQRKIAIADDLVGRAVRCPHCRQTMVCLPRKPSPSQDGPPGSDPRRLRDRLVSGAAAMALHALLFVLFAWVTLESPTSQAVAVEAMAATTLPGEQLTNAPEGSLDAALPAAESSPAADEQLTQTRVDVEIPLTAKEAGADQDVAAASPTLGGDGQAWDVQTRGTTGSGGGGGSGLGGNAKFMGIQATGHRFCIIADRSGSMSGPKIEYVKKEILTTLSDLRGGARFYVIFYDDLVDPMPGSWQQGRTAVNNLVPWIRGIYGRGGTEPSPAFEYALTRLDTRPDVIFFMTDGLIPPDVPARVAALNTAAKNKKKVVIHTVSFVDQSGAALLRLIAEQSGGKYRHVNP